MRFLSCEPLLGPLELSAWLAQRAVDWVIAGGESGPHARPMHPNWVRALRDQATAAGVPFLFKQWGAFALESAHAWRHDDGRDHGQLAILDPRGDRWSRMPALAPPDAVRMRRVGKGRAGRLLDGRTWDQFPPGARRGGSP